MLTVTKRIPFSLGCNANIIVQNIHLGSNTYSSMSFFTSKAMLADELLHLGGNTYLPMNFFTSAAICGALKPNFSSSTV